MTTLLFYFAYPRLSLIPLLGDTLQASCANPVSPLTRNYLLDVFGLWTLRRMFTYLLNPHNYT